MALDRPSDKVDAHVESVPESVSDVDKRYEGAAAHMGIIVRWFILHNALSASFFDEKALKKAALVANNEMLGSSFVLECCDGKLFGGLFRAPFDRFFDMHYDSYIKFYDNHFAATIYSFQEHDVDVRPIFGMLDEAYAEFEKDLPSIIALEKEQKSKPTIARRGLLARLFGKRK